jgi:hypothetical protein
MGRGPDPAIHESATLETKSTIVCRPPIIVEPVSYAEPAADSPRQSFIHVSS